MRIRSYTTGLDVDGRTQVRRCLISSFRLSIVTGLPSYICRKGRIWLFDDLDRVVMDRPKERFTLDLQDSVTSNSKENECRFS